MNSDNNLEFVPKAIESVSIRPGEGPNIRIAIGTVQRIAALRAYQNYSGSHDWIDKVSSAYVVALATRSADELLMKFIQDDLNNSLSIRCNKCKEASIGASLIRERLFPELKSLREHANKLIHHLDDPDNQGVSGLNIQGVFSYCHHLFDKNIDALFGIIPSPQGKFEHVKCKRCREKGVS